MPVTIRELANKINDFIEENPELEGALVCDGWGVVAEVNIEEHFDYVMVEVDG